MGGPEITPFRKQGGLLKRGLIDLIFCPTPYYGADLPEARLLGAHNKSLEEMRSNGAYDMLREAWDTGLNAHILAWPAFNVSTFYVYTKFKPKLSKQTGIDLTGVKMRSTGLYKPFLAAMNAGAVSGRRPEGRPPLSAFRVRRPPHHREQSVIRRQHADRQVLRLGAGDVEPGAGAVPGDVAAEEAA